MPFPPFSLDRAPSPPAPLPRGERGVVQRTLRQVEPPQSPSPLAGEGLGERGLNQPERGINLATTQNNHSSRKMTMNQLHYAKALRQNMTDAERLLWKHLRAHRFSGHKFRRQQPIGSYIVDFIHYGARLIVECDGGQHNDSQYDRRRDAWLEAQGFRVLRFWNHEILNKTESVLSTVFEALSPLSGRFTPLSPNPSPARGEGDRGASTQQQHTDQTNMLLPSRESNAPSDSPLPSRESNAPSDSPLPSRESSAPSDSPLPSRESSAPSDSPLPSRESSAPSDSPLPSRESSAPSDSPLPSRESSAPSDSSLPSRERGRGRGGEISRRGGKQPAKKIHSE